MNLPAPHTHPAALRVDKWLWHAQPCRSRSLAAQLCTGGDVRLNGRLITKASQVVRPGDVLTVKFPGTVRVLRVAALGDRRGPARLAATLYQEVHGREPPDRGRRDDPTQHR